MNAKLSNNYFTACLPNCQMSLQQKQMNDLLSRPPNIDLEAVVMATAFAAWSETDGLGGQLR